MDFFIFAILWVIFTLFGEWAVNWFIVNYPEVAAVQGQISDDAIFFLLKASVPIFIFVTLWIVYSMIRFRARNDEEGPAPTQVHDEWRFSWTWFVLSAAINILFVVHPGITGLQEIWAHEKVDDPLVIHVTAQQWDWSYSYPEYGIENSDILVLPVNKDSKFVLETEDVMHSFWIPSFRMKKDIMPEGARTLFIKPTKIINTENDPMTRVQCALICGVGHAEMRSEVRVVSTEEFEHWVENAQQEEAKDEGHGGH